MFGYVRPSDQRLTEEERQTFRAAYCGLCHALGRRYGAAGRMILNYDLTFLAMILSEGGSTCETRCIAHPLRKRRCACGDAAMDTAADMSVILTWWQIQDGIADHGFFGGLKYRAAALALRRAYRKARQRQPQFDADTPLWHVDISHNQIESLAGLEGNLAVNFIDADYNRIKSISKLESCIMLVRMNLWDNPVNADEVKQLQDIGILINYNPKYVEPETES